MDRPEQYHPPSVERIAALIRRISLRRNKRASYQCRQAYALREKYMSIIKLAQVFFNAQTRHA
jgi:hypothetical protein